MRLQILGKLKDQLGWQTRGEISNLVCGPKFDQMGKSTAADFMDAFSKMSISGEISSIHVRMPGSVTLLYRLNQKVKHAK